MISNSTTYIKDKIDELLSKKKIDLPTLPVVLHNVIATANDPDSSAGDLAAVIVKDQSISSKILRVANSSYYGMARKINDISQAIVLVGIREVTNLAIGTGVVSAFSKKGRESGIDLTGMWKHSVAVGFAAGCIQKKMVKAAQESFIVIGLIHDIGKIFFACYFPSEYKEVLAQMSNERVPLYVTEKKILGLDHCEMAQLLGEHWHFPRALI
jgi:HD-like signal output (HDOD) protein